MTTDMPSRNGQMPQDGRRPTSATPGAAGITVSDLPAGLPTDAALSRLANELFTAPPGYQGTPFGALMSAPPGAREGERIGSLAGSGASTDGGNPKSGE